MLLLYRIRLSFDITFSFDSILTTFAFDRIHTLSTFSLTSHRNSNLRLIIRARIIQANIHIWIDFCLHGAFNWYSSRNYTSVLSLKAIRCRKYFCIFDFWMTSWMILSLRSIHLCHAFELWGARYFSFFWWLTEIPTCWDQLIRFFNYFILFALLFLYLSLIFFWNKVPASILFYKLF